MDPVHHPVPSPSKFYCMFQNNDPGFFTGFYSVRCEMITRILIEAYPYAETLEVLKQIAPYPEYQVNSGCYEFRTMTGNTFTYRPDGVIEVDDAMVAITIIGQLKR